MKKFSKKACACIGKLLPNHSHMATCVALGGGADFLAFLREFSGVVKRTKSVIIVMLDITKIMGII